MSSTLGRAQSRWQRIAPRQRRGALGLVAAILLILTGGLLLTLALALVLGGLWLARRRWALDPRSWAALTVAAALIFLGLVHVLGSPPRAVLPRETAPPAATSLSDLPGMVSTLTPASASGWLAAGDILSGESQDPTLAYQRALFIDPANRAALAGLAHYYASLTPSTEAEQEASYYTALAGVRPPLSSPLP